MTGNSRDGASKAQERSFSAPTGSLTHSAICCNTSKGVLGSHQLPYRVFPWTDNKVVFAFHCLVFRCDTLRARACEFRNENQHDLEWRLWDGADNSVPTVFCLKLNRMLKLEVLPFLIRLSSLIASSQCFTFTLKAEIDKVSQV
jgi:hypothetical protein